MTARAFAEALSGVARRVPETEVLTPDMASAQFRGLKNAHTWALILKSPIFGLGLETFMFIVLWQVLTVVWHAGRTAKEGERRIQVAHRPIAGQGKHSPFPQQAYALAERGRAQRDDL